MENKLKSHQLKVGEENTSYEEIIWNFIAIKDSITLSYYLYTGSSKTTVLGPDSSHFSYVANCILGIT